MDNNQPLPQQAYQQPVTAGAPKARRRTSVWVWLLLTVLIVASGVLGWLYFTTQSQLDEANQLRSTMEQRLNASELSLKEAKDQLSRASFLPDKSAMSPQCYSGSNNQTRLAAVTAKPIDGYNVYIVNCVDDLVKGMSNSKVIAFKVDAAGKQVFAYGAGSGEPYCISGKIIPANAAQNISKQTGLPVCKTF